MAGHGCYLHSWGCFVAAQFPFGTQSCCWIQTAATSSISEGGADGRPGVEVNEEEEQQQQEEEEEEEEERGEGGRGRVNGGRTPLPDNPNYPTCIDKP